MKKKKKIKKEKRKKENIKNEEKDVEAKQHKPSKSEKIKKKRKRTASTSESEEEKLVSKEAQSWQKQARICGGSVPLFQSRKEHADKRTYNTFAVPPTSDPRRP